jgi:hypothetical protein
MLARAAFMVILVSGLFLESDQLTSGQTPTATEAPAGFDNQTNGLLDQAAFLEAKAEFDQAETVADGSVRCSTRNPAANATTIPFRGPSAR